MRIFIKEGGVLTSLGSIKTAAPLLERQLDMGDAGPFVRRIYTLEAVSADQRYGLYELIREEETK